MNEHVCMDSKVWLLYCKPKNEQNEMLNPILPHDGRNGYRTQVISNFYILVVAQCLFLKVSEE